MADYFTEKFASLFLKSQFIWKVRSPEVRDFCPSVRDILGMLHRADSPTPNGKGGKGPLLFRSVAASLAFCSADAFEAFVKLGHEPLTVVDGQTNDERQVKELFSLLDSQSHSHEVKMKLQKCFEPHITALNCFDSCERHYGAEAGFLHVALATFVLTAHQSMIYAEESLSEEMARRRKHKATFLECVEELDPLTSAAPYLSGGSRVLCKYSRKIESYRLRGGEPRTEAGKRRAGGVSGREELPPLKRQRQPQQQATDQRPPPHQLEIESEHKSEHRSEHRSEHKSEHKSENKSEHSERHHHHQSERRFRASLPRHSERRDERQDERQQDERRLRRSLHRSITTTKKPVHHHNTESYADLLASRESMLAKIDLLTTDCTAVCESAGDHLEVKEALAVLRGLQRASGPCLDALGTRGGSALRNDVAQLRKELSRVNRKVQEIFDPRSKLGEIKSLWKEVVELTPAARPLSGGNGRTLEVLDVLRHVLVDTVSVLRDTARRSKALEEDEAKYSANKQEVKAYDLFVGPCGLVRELRGIGIVRKADNSMSESGQQTWDQTRICYEAGKDVSGDVAMLIAAAAVAQIGTKTTRAAARAAMISSFEEAAKVAMQTLGEEAAEEAFQAAQVAMDERTTVSDDMSVWKDVISELKRFVKPSTVVSEPAEEAKDDDDDSYTYSENESDDDIEDLTGEPKSLEDEEEYPMIESVVKPMEEVEQQSPILLLVEEGRADESKVEEEQGLPPQFSLWPGPQASVQKTSELTSENSEAKSAEPPSQASESLETSLDLPSEEKSELQVETSDLMSKKNHPYLPLPRAAAAPDFTEWESSSSEDDSSSDAEPPAHT